MFHLYLCLCLFLCLCHCLFLVCICVYVNVCSYVYVYINVNSDLPELKGGGKHMMAENRGGVKTLLRSNSRQIICFNELLAKKLP